MSDDVQQGPPQSTPQRLGRLPSVLIGYANDIEKHGRPIDSGLPEILRFIATEIPHYVINEETDPAQLTESCSATMQDDPEACIYCGKDSKTCEHFVDECLVCREDVQNCRCERIL